MSAHVVVIGSDLRRATVKVNPGTYLTDVLQEACKKLNLSSDKYLLKYAISYSRLLFKLATDNLQTQAETSRSVHSMAGQRPQPRRETRARPEVEHALRRLSRPTTSYA